MQTGIASHMRERPAAVVEAGRDWRCESEGTIRFS